MAPVVLPVCESHTRYEVRDGRVVDARLRAEAIYGAMCMLWPCGAPNGCGDTCSIGRAPW